MLQYVMLATDGSAAAERAADFAATLAARYGARVIVLHTFPPVLDFLGEPNYSQRLDKTLSEARSLAGDVFLIGSRQYVATPDASLEAIAPLERDGIARCAHTHSNIQGKFSLF